MFRRIDSKLSRKDEKGNLIEKCLKCFHVWRKWKIYIPSMLQSISRIHGSIRCRTPRHVTRTTCAFHPKARQWLHANPCLRYNFIRGKKSFEAVRQSWGRARPIRSTASYNTWCSEWTAGDTPVPSSCILHKRWRHSYEKHTRGTNQPQPAIFLLHSSYCRGLSISAQLNSEVRCCGNVYRLRY